jgi:hypothetical protein
MPRHGLHDHGRLLLCSSSPYCLNFSLLDHLVPSRPNTMIQPSLRLNWSKVEFISMTGATLRTSYRSIASIRYQPIRVRKHPLMIAKTQTRSWSFHGSSEQYRAFTSRRRRPFPPFVISGMHIRVWHWVWQLGPLTSHSSLFSLLLLCMNHSTHGITIYIRM